MSNEITSLIPNKTKLFDIFVLSLTGIPITLLIKCLRNGSIKVENYMKVHWLKNNLFIDLHIKLVCTAKLFHNILFTYTTYNGELRVLITPSFLRPLLSQLYQKYIKLYPSIIQLEQTVVYIGKIIFY